jgi:uncharacterized protein (DUF1330 family)
MPAYIIVEIDVTDPVGYEEYKKQAAAAVRNMAANTSCAAARAKRWKVIGNQNAS